MMTTRTARVLSMLGAFVAGLVLVFGAILLVSNRFPITNQAAAQIGGPFRLTDQDGRTVTDQDLKGKPLLVFFGFTHCPDVCPTTLFDISEVLRSLGPDADRLGAAFITVDPERDTPATMKDYLASFDPHLRGLTGDADAIRAVTRAYRVYYKKVPLQDGDYTMDHSALVYLMSKDGQFIGPFNTKRPPQVAADDLRKYL
jgi:protein SCO1